MYDEYLRAKVHIFYLFARKKRIIYCIAFERAHVKAIACARDAVHVRS